MTGMVIGRQQFRLKSIADTEGREGNGMHAILLGAEGSRDGPTRGRG